MKKLKGGGFDDSSFVGAGHQRVWSVVRVEHDGFSWLRMVEMEGQRKHDRKGWNAAGDGKGLRKAEVGLKPPKWALV